MFKKPSRQVTLQVIEIILAVILTYGFRMLVDWFLAPLPIGQWIVLIRWLLLILFIGAAIRLHTILMAFLKNKGVISQDTL
jgi:hypothetical protein